MLLVALFLAGSSPAASAATVPVWRKPENTVGFKALRTVVQRLVRERPSRTHGVQHLCAVVEDPTGQNQYSPTMPVTAWLYWPADHYLFAFGRSALAPSEEPVGSAMQSIDLKREVFARDADMVGSIRGVRRSVPNRIIAACRNYGSFYSIESRHGR